MSNDGGFNGLIQHLKKIGRTCKKVSTNAAKPAKKSRYSTSGALSAEASAVMFKLKEADGRTRPRKREKLLNWMKCQSKGLINGASPEDVYEELVRASFVEESGAKISYDTER